MNRERLQYYTGEVKQVLSGHAVDAEIAGNAASGGIVTALLAGMLERGELDGALVCRLRGLEVEVFIARTRAELISAQGSIYFAFPPLGRETMEELRNFSGRLAVVGLPCTISALRKIPELRDKVVLTVGLFCGHTSRPELIRRVLARKGIAERELKAFRFRRGLWRGEAEALLADGSRKNWPTAYYNLYQNLFIQCHAPCMSCFDHFAEEADISCGDVWIMKHKNDKIKHSAVAVRTEAGADAVSRARESGDLLLREESDQLLYAANKRAAVFHKAVRARALAGKLCGVKIKVPARARRTRWNELLAALMIVPLYRFSVKHPGAAMKIPRPLLKFYLYAFKGLTNF